jgi:hypothetical protein
MERPTFGPSLASLRSRFLLFGRQAELAATSEVLDRARGGEATKLVLEGPPGIGKTALLDAAWQMAGDFERVRITAFESEHELPWAALASLLASWSTLNPNDAPVLNAVVAGEHLPAAGVGAALHAAIVRAATARPLLLLIDDAQWLDSPTRDLLAFALRRLGVDPRGRARRAAARSRAALHNSEHAATRGTLE